MNHFHFRHIPLLCLCLFACIKASAYDACVDDIYYNFSANEAEVTYLYYDSRLYSYTSDYSGDIVIPDYVTWNNKTYSVTSISDHAFYNCDNLTSVTIPNSVMNIGEQAFFQCGSLTSIILPSSLTSIGKEAFYGCLGLTSVSIPKDVTSIGEGVFWNCGGLASITVEEENNTYDSRYDCNAIIKTETNSLIAGCKNTVIPNGVTEIGNYAFANQDGLTSISFPKSITTIGRYSFVGCNGLISITIPDNVTVIGNSAFRECSHLTNITLGKGLQRIDNGAFDVIQPQSIHIRCTTPPTIYRYVFANYIYDNTTLYVPIGCMAAYKAASFWQWFEDIIEEEETHSPDIVFTDPAVKSVCVANWDTNNDRELSEAEAAAVTDLGEVFKSNIEITSFNELKYFTGLTCIGNNAFNTCSNLSSITIPDGVTSIGDYVFQGCTSLARVYCYAESVPTTGSNVFGSYIGSATLYVPAASGEAYSTTEPWSDFGMIVAINETQAGNTIACTNIRVHRGQQVELPIEMTNEADLAIVGISFTLTLPEGVTFKKNTNGKPIYSLVDSRLDSEDFSVTTEMYSNSSVGVRIVSFGSTTAALQGTEGAFMTFTLDLAGTLETGNYNISLTENKLSVRNSDNSVTSTVIGNSTSKLTIKDVIMGDVNGDDEVDLSDAIMVIYYSLHVAPANFIEAAADLNNDEEIDLSDAITIIYMSLGVQPGNNAKHINEKATDILHNIFLGLDRNK